LINTVPIRAGIG